MKLFHRIMMLTLILCLVFGLAAVHRRNPRPNRSKAPCRRWNPRKSPGQNP